MRERILSIVNVVPIVSDLLTNPSRSVHRGTSQKEIEIAEHILGADEGKVRERADELIASGAIVELMTELAPTIGRKLSETSADPNGGIRAAEQLETMLRDDRYVARLKELLTPVAPSFLTLLARSLRKAPLPPETWTQAMRSVRVDELLYDLTVPRYIRHAMRDQLRATACFVAIGRILEENEPRDQDVTAEIINVASLSLVSTLDAIDVSKREEDDRRAAQAAALFAEWTPRSGQSVPFAVKRKN